MADTGADAIVRVGEEFLNGGCLGGGLYNDEGKWGWGGGSGGGEGDYALTVVAEMDEKRRAGRKEGGRKEG